MRNQRPTILRCPTCGRSIDRRATRFAPFCSERCKLIDLGHWLDESYRIPGEPADVGSGETEETPGDPEPGAGGPRSKLSR
ncbi:MAG: DNA gyrase inhibitor YacG [Candidatus Dadabacteria bacterium]|nr:MAG: DNA gyrase inhibitor YacG [Candidatus Dadabacteria bacterium]